MSQVNKTLVKLSQDKIETQPAVPQIQTRLKTQTRPWLVSILGLLLLLQAAGLFDLGLFFFTRGLGLKRSLIVEAFITTPINSLAMGIVFIPLSLLALLAAIGFFRLWRAAWLMAMLLQGLSLLAALVLYFNQRPGYVYIIMLYSILLVLYLNYFETSTTLPPAASLEEENNEG
ncbi:MAG: hypothetical protein HS126_13380 [Anaerolineales bacterium]|nr:hypothetical protein [Anaerolineales bacterium]